jgi:hypothetical protein
VPSSGRLQCTLMRPTRESTRKLLSSRAPLPYSSYGKLLGDEVDGGTRIAIAARVPSPMGESWGKAAYS